MKCTCKKALKPEESAGVKFLLTYIAILFFVVMISIIAIINDLDILFDEFLSVIFIFLLLPWWVLIYTTNSEVLIILALIFNIPLAYCLGVFFKRQSVKHNFFTGKMAAILFVLIILFIKSIYAFNLFDSPILDCEINKPDEVRSGFYKTNKNLCYTYVNGGTSDSLHNDYWVYHEPDFETFEQVFSLDNGLSSEFQLAKDKDSVYFFELVGYMQIENVLLHKLHNLNPDKLEIVYKENNEDWSGYIKDQKYVYYHEMIVSHADAISFDVLSSGYAKDNSSIFYQEHILKEADINTFDVKEHFARDKKSVFINSKKIPEADPITFEKIENDFKSDFYRDKSFVFYKNKNKKGVHKVEGADPESITMISNDFLKDRNNVYFQGQKLDIADLNTFEVEGYNSAKDQFKSYKIERNHKGRDTVIVKDL